MNFPILTPELVARIVKAENSVSLARLKCIAKLEGNPLGAASREFGHVLATMMPRFPERWWDRVSGIAAGDEGLIDELLAWYRAASTTCTFDLAPPQSSEELLKALTVRGFYQSAFRTVLYGAPETSQPPPSSRVVVREQPDLKVFLDVAARTGFLRTDQEFWREYIRTQFSESRCYVAFVDGKPAAHAVMQTCDGTALLNYGATIEQYRSHGCQTALLRARLADAAEAGCDLAIVQANPGSTSQRNIERVGMRVAFTKAIWSETSNVLPGGQRT